MVDGRDDPAPPAFIHRIPTRLLIGLFGICLLAAAWLYVLRTAVLDRAAEIERIHQENGRLARTLEEHVRGVVKRSDGILLFLQGEYQKHGRVTETMVGFVELAKQDPFLNQIALAGVRGDLLLSAVPLKKTVNIAHREHFQVQAASPVAGLFLSKPVITQASGTWSFFLSRRLNNTDGSFAGIVSIGLNPQHFSDYYSLPELGATRSIMLVGTDGVVRARRFQENVEVGQDISGGRLFQALSGGGTGHYEVVSGIDRLVRFASYRLMPDYPLIVLVADLKSAALAPYLQRRNKYLYSAVLFTLFVAGFVILLMRADARSRRQNARLAEELTERTLAEERIKALFEYNRKLFDVSLVGNWIVDLVELTEGDRDSDPCRERHERIGFGIVTRDVNARICAMLGYEREEILGRSLLDPLFVDEQNAEILEKQMIIRRRGERSSYEAALKSKSGRLVPVLINATPTIVDEKTGRALQALGSMTDLTALKTAAGERERLIAQLQEAAANVRTLSGLLPICASCKKIRDDRGYWNQIEVYLANHADVSFTHSMCADCAKKWRDEAKAAIALQDNDAEK